MFINSSLFAHISVIPFLKMLNSSFPKILEWLGVGREIKNNFIPSPAMGRDTSPVPGCSEPFHPIFLEKQHENVNIPCRNSCYFKGTGSFLTGKKNS